MCTCKRIEHPPIWHFLTFLDEEGYPHATIHLKDREWLYKKHPDDGKSEEPDATWLFAPSPVDESGRARWWVNSTTYDDVDFDYNKPIMFLGNECVIMGAGHRDKDHLFTGEKRLLDLWYEQVKVPGAQSVNWRNWSPADAC